MRTLSPLGLAASIVTGYTVHGVRNKKSFSNEKSVNRLIDGTSVKKRLNGNREGSGEPRGPFTISSLIAFRCNGL